jgi:signal transduction histidine kinase
LRHTGDGTTVRIHLGVHQARQRAVLTVSDRGPGMREEELKRAFQPFFRADSAADGDGFGLGLAIAKRAIEVHKGTIIAENLPGGGLRVTIELPLDVQTLASSDLRIPAASAL